MWSTLVYLERWLQTALPWVPTETNRIPSWYSRREALRLCTEGIQRPALLVTFPSRPVISKAAFTVTCFDWEPLEILNNVLLKSSKTPLLTEYWEERVGRRTDGKGESPFCGSMWFDSVTFNVWKRKAGWFINNQRLKYFWFPFIVLLGTNQLCLELWVIRRVFFVICFVFKLIQEP